jgi:xylono-1,5-lactonase
MLFEKIAGGFGAVEAPRADAHGNLYFSDIIHNKLHKRTPDGTVHCLLSERINIGGIAFNQDGRLICSGKGGLIVIDERSGAAEPLLTHIEGLPVDVVNDIQVDDQGSIYGGTFDYAAMMSGQPAVPGVLFRLDPPDRITVLSRDVSVSNGIGFSPDRTRLYHSDTRVGIWEYELAPDRSARGRKLFASLPGSDGLAVDVQGGVWAACYLSSEILHFTPAGVIQRRFKFDDPAVLSVSFGGTDGRDLYVATSDSFTGPPSGAGAIYRARCDVAGQALPVARF